MQFWQPLITAAVTSSGGTITLTRTLAESAAASDTYSRAPVNFDLRTVSESALLADAYSRVIAVDRTLLESVLTGGNYSRLVTVSRSVIESVLAESTFSRTARIARTVNEVATVADLLSQDLTAGFTVSEAVSADATFSRTVTPGNTGRSQWLRSFLINYYEEKFTKKEPKPAERLLKVAKKRPPQQVELVVPEHLEAEVAQLQEANVELLRLTQQSLDATRFLNSIKLSALQFESSVSINAAILMLQESQFEEEQLQRQEDELLLLSLVL